MEHITQPPPLLKKKSPSTLQKPREFQLPFPAGRHIATLCSSGRQTAAHPIPRRIKRRRHYAIIIWNKDNRSISHTGKRISGYSLCFSYFRFPRVEFFFPPLCHAPDDYSNQFPPSTSPFIRERKRGSKSKRELFCVVSCIQRRRKRKEKKKKENGIRKAR